MASHVNQARSPRSAGRLSWRDGSRSRRPAPALHPGRQRPARRDPDQDARSRATSCRPAASSPSRYGVARMTVQTGDPRPARRGPRRLPPGQRRLRARAHRPPRRPTPRRRARLPAPATSPSTSSASPPRPCTAPSRSRSTRSAPAPPRPSRSRSASSSPTRTKPAALPCRAEDLADDPAFRERSHAMTQRHTEAIIDAVARARRTRPRRQRHRRGPRAPARAAVQGLHPQPRGAVLRLLPRRPPPGQAPRRAPRRSTTSWARTPRSSTTPPATTTPRPAPSTSSRCQAWFDTIWTTVAQPADADDRIAPATSSRRCSPRTRYLLLDFDGPICAIFAGRPAPRRRARARSTRSATTVTRCPTHVAAPQRPVRRPALRRHARPDGAERRRARLRAAELDAVAHRHANSARRRASSTPGATPAGPSPPSATTPQAAVSAYLAAHGIELDAGRRHAPAPIQPCSSPARISSPSAIDALGADAARVRPRRRLAQRHRCRRSTPASRRSATPTSPARATALAMPAPTVVIDDMRALARARQQRRLADRAPARASSLRCAARALGTSSATSAGASARHHDQSRSASRSAAPPASRSDPGPRRPADASTPTAPDQNADRRRDGSGSIATSATAARHRRADSCSAHLHARAPGTGADSASS